MKKHFYLSASLVFLLAQSLAYAEVITSETNNGNLVMQDILEIPASIVPGLNPLSGQSYLTGSQSLRPVAASSGRAVRHCR